MPDTDLIAFLKAQFDKDEEGAREPSGWRSSPADMRWVYQPDGDPDLPGGDVIARGHRIVMDQPEMIAAHIARFDPARVLAEVETKRRILEIHGTGSDPCDAHDASMRTIPCDTLLSLALPYSDHLDYQEKWKP